jgi:F0F1-type ATP synthase assembly protein I
VGRERNLQSRRYAIAIDLTIQGVASLLIGAGLGWWLTEKHGAPIWVLLICIVLGVAAAVLTMVRYQRRLDRLEERESGKPGQPS